MAFKMNRRLLAAASVTLLAACGGGGGDPGDPAAPASPAMAGAYTASDATGSASVIVDDQGNMFATSRNVAFHPTLVLQQFVDFSGTAMAAGEGAWRIDSALVWSNDTSGPPLTESKTTSRSPVSGAFVAGQALSFTVTKPPAPPFYRGSYTASLNTDSGTGPVSLTDVVGRYQGTICAGSPREPGPCEVVTDYTIGANGRVSGKFLSLVGEPPAACQVDATVVVASAERRILRATGTLSGATCPMAQGQSLMLAEVQRAGDSRHVTWWFADAEGRVRQVLAVRL